MKNIKKIAALFLLGLYIAIAASCQASDKTLAKINNYLTDQYPGESFTVMSYTKRNETSGRYEVNAVRNSSNGDNDIDFQIYIYSTISATDSYSVTRANLQMEKAIKEELAKTNKELPEKIAKIQWLDIYDDNAYDYSFRHVDAKKEYTIKDLHYSKIHRVVLADGLTISSVGSAIYDFMNDFYDNTPYVIKDTTFVYSINKVEYEFTTDSKTVHELGKAGITNLLLQNLVTTVENDNRIITSSTKFSYISETAEENRNVVD